MIVRPAEPRDDEVLLRIESMAGQGDRVRLIDERDSFFSRARQFSDTILLVGENEATGALHGVVAAAVQRLLIEGQERVGAYMFDLRSNPEANKGLSRAMFFLWRSLEERLMVTWLQVCDVRAVATCGFHFFGPPREHAL